MSEISEADVDRAVAGAFGRHQAASDPGVVEAFREAGFTDAEAEQGVAMLASGRFFSWEDVAGSLAMPRAHVGPRRVSEASIAEAGRRLAARQAGGDGSPEAPARGLVVTESDLEAAVAVAYGRTPISESQAGARR